MDDFIYTSDTIRCIDLKSMTLVQALGEIEQRPVMWLQVPDLPNLWSFVSGWNVGRGDEAEARLLFEFQEFVATQYAENSGEGWCRIICKHYGDEAAFSGFFALFRKFRALRESS